MNGFVICGVASALAYTAMQILFKRSAAYSGNPVVLTAWWGLLLPIWLGVLVLGVQMHLFVVNWSTPYVLWAVTWAVLATGSLTLMIWLIQRLGLVEMTAYRKAFAVAIALSVDVLWLGVSFNPMTIAAMALILAGALMLSAQDGWPSGADLLRRLFATALLAALLTVQLYVYKEALTYQTDVLAHVFVTKAMISILGLGLWVFPTVYRAPRPASWGLIGAMVVCFIIASITEGYALQGLPTTLVILTSIVAAACFTAYDAWNGDIAATRRSWLAVTAVLSGFAILALTS